MSKIKHKYEMGMIVPTDGEDVKDAARNLSFLKKVMTCTVRQHFSRCEKLKIIKSKFVLHAPEKGAVGPLFTGHFKLEWKVKDQPSAVRVVEGDAGDPFENIDEEASKE